MKQTILHGFGHAIPSGQIDNDQIEAELELASGWIKQRTGIVRRRVVEQHQATSDLAIEAGQMAMRQSNAPAATDYRALILATSTPDHLLPPTAPMVASKLGMKGVAAFDMAVACSGFVYGLVVAQSLSLQLDGPVMLIAANVLSKRVNPLDRNTRSLFADAAGAAVVEVVQAANQAIAGAVTSGIVATHLESLGEQWSSLMIPAGGSRQPIDERSLQSHRHFMQINDGRGAYRYAVERMAQCGQIVLEKAGLSIDDVDWWIPHQANLRVIEEVQKRLGATDQQTAVVVEQLGNSSAATIPVALSLLSERQQLVAGQTVLLTAAGAGLTAGAALFRT